MVLVGDDLFGCVVGCVCWFVGELMLYDLL